MTSCPWCNAPRDTAQKCPNCGAIYAKAEAIKSHGRANIADLPHEAQSEESVPFEASIESSLQGLPLIEDPVLEWKLCIGAIPIVLCFALVFHVFMPFLQRTFLGMPVHEIGHAVTAWLCGYVAVPTPWLTHVSETRGFIAPITLLGALGYMMYRAYLAKKYAYVALGGLLVLLQVICTLGIKATTAQMLFVFGGDGAGMVLATALMTTFFFGKGTQLYRGSLRWGFLVIGAAAFVDIFATWWAAWRDSSMVPFGEFESGLKSDALRLTDDYGWSTDALIHRYVTIGICCMIVLALVYAWGVRQARRTVSLL